jgi:hypothetical protein
MSQSRNHHYLSQCYFKNFAKPRSKSGKFCVFDLRDGKTFLSVPRNVGSKRDYNRIEMPNVAPDFFETELSKFESDLEHAFHRIIKSNDISNRNDFDFLLMFLALICANNPAFRSERERFMTDVADRLMNLLTSDRKIWESTTARMKADGLEVSESVSFEEMQSAVREKRIVPGISREALIGQEMKLWRDILPILESRSWSLLKAGPDAGEFITADRPFNLRAKREEGDSAIYRLGLGTPETTLTLPISPTLMMMGSFKEGGAELILTRGQVAALNLGTFSSALRQIYARADFPVIDTTGEIIQFSQSDLWSTVRMNAKPRAGDHE